MMELVNLFYKKELISKDIASKFVLMLSCFAPHICEELWELMGNSESLAYEKWPKFDEKYTKDDTVTISIQVNGKLRATLEHDLSLGKEEVLELAKKIPGVSKYIEGKTIRKEIYVPKKIVNFVV